MQSSAPQQLETLDLAFTDRGIRRFASRRLPLLTIAAGTAFQLLLGFGISAQTPPTPAAEEQQTPHSTSHPIAHARRKSAVTKTAAPPVQAQLAAPVPIVPDTPPPPNWPANNKPVEATVVWDSRGLLVQASNSSLNQILNDISVKIGAKVEGIGADERIFGTYGPGPAREVLTQLLDGTGYNILMMGDQGAGTPRKIALSGRPNGPAPPRGNNPAFNDNSQDNDQDAEPRPFEPNPVMPPTPGMTPGMPRTPQQMQQLMEERQRQMQNVIPQEPQN